MMFHLDVESKLNKLAETENILVTGSGADWGCGKWVNEVKGYKLPE